MKPHQYLIRVNGRIREADRQWLGGLTIERQTQDYTALRGDFDQSALLGVLSLLRHLDLEVFEVRRVCQCPSPLQSCGGDPEPPATPRAGATRGQSAVTSPLGGAPSGWTHGLAVKSADADDDVEQRARVAAGVRSPRRRLSPDS
jgi:hypothetical protein